MNPISKPVPNAVQYLPVFLAMSVLGLVVAAAGNIAGQKQALAALTGALAGFSLYHASFGFTSAWRRVVTEGRGSGLRYQFLLIILTSAVSFPLLAYGRDFGIPVGGFVAPVGTGMLFGAFVFGIGMQFGGGCGSGTLFVAGGGSTRMCITLAAFVAGSLVGSLHFPWWASLPRYKAWSMVANMGPLPAFLVLTLVLITIGCFTIWRERNLHGELEIPRKTESFLKGPWSPLAGAVAIMIVSVLTLLIVGRPWGVTGGFALWGAKVANAMGIDVLGWPYWENRAGSVERSVFYHVTSVMNFGILAGAMAAAALAAKFKPVLSLTRVEIGTAIIGGLLMGYGARLAYGCNIGAYLGGLISGSLHGWAWAVAAFAGSALAIFIKQVLRI